MRILDTLVGRGMLNGNNLALGEVDYRLSRFATSTGAHDASGSISGDPLVLVNAFEARELKLTRQDTGRSIDIAIKNMNGGTTAEVVFTGPNWGD